MMPIENLHFPDFGSDGSPSPAYKPTGFASDKHPMDFISGNSLLFDNA
jgi:hypothetical protein